HAPIQPGRTKHHRHQSQRAVASLECRPRGSAEERGGQSLQQTLRKGRRRLNSAGPPSRPAFTMPDGIAEAIVRRLKARQSPEKERYGSPAVADENSAKKMTPSWLKAMKILRDIVLALSAMSAAYFAHHAGQTSEKVEQVATQQVEKTDDLEKKLSTHAKESS